VLEITLLITSWLLAAAHWEIFTPDACRHGDMIELESPTDRRPKPRTWQTATPATICGSTTSGFSMLRSQPSTKSRRRLLF